MKTWLLIIVPFCFSQLSFAYLNEHTSNYLKVNRQTNYKQVAISETPDSDGVIRNISWQGPHHPDLKLLLGPCYTYYQDFLKQGNKLRTRGPVTIERNGCHINIGGHMRSVHGKVSLDK